MSVGVDVLDKDHIILIGCLNDFIDACENDEGIFVTDSIFIVLLNYTDTHFKREEKIMEACGYVGLDPHKELHESLRQKIIDNRERFVLNPSGELEDEIKDFLQSWLRNHILGCDMEYVSTCAGKEKQIAEILEQENAT
ncbi:MAG: hemerythrin family protein [Rhodospirillales bacterium]|nr:hemerythrin family protein [Rhodospirillales bacterium]